MGFLKTILLLCGPLLVLVTFLLLRFYNNGYGSLDSKRWALITSPFTFIFAITSIVLYIIFPKQDVIFDKKDIETLEDLEEMVIYLNDFIGVQREEIESLSLKLDQLNSEHLELEQIVELEKEMVLSVLSAFDYWHHKRIWYEYLAAFFIGIFATLVGSALIEFFTN